MEKNNPPEWAIKEACKRACVQYEGYLGWGNVHSKKLMIECAARYIAEHEEKPVDPLLLEAREICAAVATEWKRSAAEVYRDGLYDSDDEVLFVLATLKRMKEQS